MTTVKWKFSVEDKLHEVIFKRYFVPNPEIWLDGQMVEKWREFLDKESIHNFDIDGHPAVLGIALRMSALEYFLLIDGKLVEADDKGKKLFGKSASQFVDTRQKWLDLGKTYKLEYHPSLKVKRLAYQHRLIGYMNDYLIAVYPGSKRSGDAVIPGTYLVLRYANINPEKIEAIEKDENISETLKEWLLTKASLEIYPTGAILFIHDILKDEKEEDALECISNFIPAMSRHVRPAIKEKCEGPFCKLTVGQDFRLVLMNDMPTILCQDCIEHIDDIGKKAELEYQETPNNLLKGTIYGIAGMLLSILLWLIFPIIFNTVYPFFAVFPFAFIMQAMNYAKTKKNFASLLIVSLLSLIGSVFGTYLSLVICWIKKNNWVFDFSLLVKLTQRIVENPKIMIDTINFSIVVLVLFLILGLYSRHQELKRLFKPEVEVILSFKLQ